MSETGAAPTWALVLVILLWAIAQYGLAAWTLRDLARRPAVSGGSKTAWALALLAVPVIGPLAYLAVHPVPPPLWLTRTPVVAADVAARAAAGVAWAAQAAAQIAQLAAGAAWAARQTVRRAVWFGRLRRWLAAPPRWRERPPRWIVPPRAPRDRDVSPPVEHP